ncbi:MAG: DUF4389 domain-containing protein, partial [Flavobacteriales bacterium]|nr:DUF4389 domain-containing protein [Flavobacteriales bacterium]
MAEQNNPKRRTTAGSSKPKAQSKANQPARRTTQKPANTSPKSEVLKDVADAQSYTAPCGLHLDIDRQKEYSGGQAILRALFGVYYIAIPHGFIMYFLSIWSFILGFIAWWIMLFKGSYPKNWYAYQIKLMKWQVRVASRFLHLRDDYPKFGLNAEEEGIRMHVEYPGRVNRGLLLVKTIFRVFFLIPHLFCVY